MVVFRRSRLQTSPVRAGPEAGVAQRQAAAGRLRRLQQGEPHGRRRRDARPHRAVQRQSTGNRGRPGAQELAPSFTPEVKMSTSCAEDVSSVSPAAQRAGFSLSPRSAPRDGLCSRWCSDSFSQ